MKNTTTLSKKYGKLKPIVTRKYIPLLSDYFIQSYADAGNYKRFYFVEHYNRYGYINGKFYYGDEYKQLGEIIILKEDNNRGFIKKIFAIMYELGEKLLVLSEELKKVDYSDMPKIKLIDLFKRFSEMFKQFSISLASHSIQYPVEKRLKKLVENRKDPNEDLSILIFPRKDNFSTLEQSNFLKILILVKQYNIKKFEDLSVKILEKIQEHIKEFGWINARGGQAESWSEREIFERIIHHQGNFAKKLVEFDNHKIEYQKKTEKLLKELNASEDIINLVDIAKELVYFRTYRTDYLNKIFFNVKPLFESIAKNRNITYREIMYLRIKEIEENIEVKKDEIERRIVDYALITIEPNKIIFTSNHEKIKKIMEQHCEDPIPTSKITGRSAFVSHEKVRGIVKIIIDKFDLSKINAGDIMVSPMTTPDFIMAMEKAAAFVTDEGGITCHAAIVAREMKKPCIIGTKTATQSLKDGDFVEIDTESGVVKIIKKA